MPYNKIDGLKLKVFPLKERKSYIDIKTVAVCPGNPPPVVESLLADKIKRLAERIKQARDKGKSVMLVYGAHLIKNGGAIGRAAGTDARIFANSVLNQTNGVYMSIGCAIMSPQVFEKAFSAANNLRHQKGEKFIKDHYLAINDIAAGGDWDWSQGEPPKEHPAYYLRFCKSFYRMGGTVDYLCVDNRAMLSNLISELKI